MTRVFREVKLEYRLATPTGVTPTTQSKRWFFEVPAARDTPDAWKELLERLFYDANVKLRRRQPSDQAYLKLDSFTVHPVDAMKTMAWSGERNQAAAEAHMPWQLSRVVWEWSACLLVDEGGRYDGVAADDYSELIAFRLHAEGKIDDAQCIAFLQKVYPSKPTNGQLCFDNREKRLANIVVIRSLPGHFRKTPGQEPFVSGPVHFAHVGF